MIVLAQTVASDWVITMRNPEDHDGEAELATFNTSATGYDTAARTIMERLAAEAAVRLAGASLPVFVESHDAGSKARMTARVVKAGGSLSLRFADT